METSAKLEGQSLSGIIIMDLKSGTQTILIPHNKTYMTVNLKEMADKKGSPSKEGEIKKMPKLTPTGKQETIAGFTCEHWIVGDEQDTDLCVAKGFGIFGFGDEGQSGGPWRALKNLNLDPNYSDQLAASPEWKRFTEGGMFPLRISHIEKGQAKTVLEVTNVEPKKLDDSLFKTPPDYKKIEIPGMPSGAK
ncbi:MAG: DUF4412 domain-containing protein [Acidobacteria bacterium]|nr:DUF4412 domain-containing protein [Acidobacteriota bacterium]